MRDASLDDVAALGAGFEDSLGDAECAGLPGQSGLLEGGQSVRALGGIVERLGFERAPAGTTPSNLAGWSFPPDEIAPSGAEARWHV